MNRDNGAPLVLTAAGLLTAGAIFALRARHGQSTKEKHRRRAVIVSNYSLREPVCLGDFREGSHIVHRRLGLGRILSVSIRSEVIPSARGPYISNYMDHDVVNPRSLYRLAEINAEFRDIDPKDDESYPRFMNRIRPITFWWSPEFGWEGVRSLRVEGRSASLHVGCRDSFIFMDFDKNSLGSPFMDPYAVDRDAKKNEELFLQFAQAIDAKKKIIISWSVAAERDPEKAVALERRLGRMSTGQILNNFGLCDQEMRESVFRLVAVVQNPKIAKRLNHRLSCMSTVELLSESFLTDLRRLLAPGGLRVDRGAMISDLVAMEDDPKKAADMESRLSRMSKGEIFYLYVLSTSRVESQSKLADDYSELKVDPEPEPKSRRVRSRSKSASPGILRPS
jgi:hypothetical protein